ncbi:MAG TPA: bacillithiol biosynthesis BshC [Acidobacteriota bacterium]|nr:bacillithiol biosynthesis BshC [Acidobacteriota bacterium]
MNSLDYRRLPGINSLFLDYIGDVESAQPFYPSRERYRTYDPPHRKELTTILRAQNQRFGNIGAEPLIQVLEQTASSCLVTGQQVGLLTGPMYTLWKALTAIKISQDVQKQTQRPCVPLFWMASEDHNWHEVMSFGLLKGDFELLKFSLKEHFFMKREPTGQLSVNHPEVRKILLRALHEIKIPQISDFYSSGTLTDGFARTLSWLLKDTPMILLDPSDPTLKQLAKPFFKRFFEKSSDLQNLLEQQNEKLRSNNYPTQVKMEQDQLPLFLIDSEERCQVKKNGVSSDTPVEKLSPAALLRPIFQDFLLPSAAYVGGPAEIAYFAQLHPWYQALGVEQPPVLPRASITLLPPATDRFLQSSNLNPEEIYLPEDTLADVLIQHTGLDKIRTDVRALAAFSEERIKSIQKEAEKVDPTLAKAIVTAGSKIQFQTKKIEHKALLAVKRKNQELLDKIRKAKNVIYPDEKLQERYLNIFSFRDRLPDLIAELHQKVDVYATAHQWVEI